MGEPLISETTIGETLQRLRVARNISLRTLAATAEFSPSFLSQVENGQTSPSIASLDRLARTLGLTLADFFEEVASADAPVVMRAADRKALRSGWSKAKFSSLVPHGALQRLESILITLQPGGRSGRRLESLPYEQLALVLEGSPLLVLPSGETILSEGDAVALPAGTAHQWKNETAAAAIFVLVAAGRGAGPGKP
jgi:transcriptional regulator with XRE-family HTH domain